MKILIVPDSFKGSMTAQEFCTTAKKCIHSIMPDTQVIQMPVADGGEGTLDCILSAVEGFTETIKVTGAFAGKKRSVRVGFTGNTAIIESAEAMGLPSVGERKNPLLTTTYGVGQMIENTIKLV